MTADLLLETNSNGQHNIQKSNFTGTGNHTLSIYAKAYGLVNRKLRIATYDPLNGGTDAVTAFDLINGTFQTGESGGDFYGSAEMIFVGNGWYRCIVYTENLIDPAGIYFGLSNGVYDFNYQGDGTSGIYVWGAQLERGFTAGRYIKTFGTAITAPTTVKNLSSTSYAGTVNGGAVFNSAGYFEFNGSTDRRIIVDTNSSINSLNGAFTIEFWGNIYMSDDDNATFILDARNTNSSASPSWYIYETDIGGLPRINLQINITSGPSVEISTSTVFTPNQLSGWKHFVFSRTGIGSNQSFVYVNGSLDTTGTLPNNITSGHTKLHIGANSSGSQRLNGNIGEVRFYNRALSATEVSKNFNATSGKYGV
jgi:hypothetical protein